MRKPIVFGNWKMNLDRAGSLGLVKGLKAALAGDSSVDAGVCPPFVYLDAVARELAGSAIALGAQDVYFESKGAFTGEVSAEMLLDVGCAYAIIGHSERRHVMGETDELINRKALAALKAGLKVILCVGELLAERDAGRTESVVERQLVQGLRQVAAESLAALVIAYEPVWAIGTGRNATAQQAGEVHAFIRGKIKELYGSAAAQALRIQYGGSVKPENTYELMSVPDVDGALVGGASLKVEIFAEIVKEAGRAAGRGV